MTAAMTPDQGTVRKPAISRQSVALVGLAVLAAFLAGTLLAHRLSPLCDDAFISLVYARNLLAGHGLTFNGAVVQGYTNPLWVLLIAALGRCGLPLPLACTMLSVATGLLLVTGTCLLAWRLHLPLAACAAAGIVVALSFDFVIYLTAGLETLLFGALLVFTLLLLLARPLQLRHAVGAGLAAGLLAVCRPEGLLFVLLVPALLLRSNRSLAVAAGIAAAAVATPWFLWAHAFYGDWLPNSFYAKNARFGVQQFHRGLAYLVPDLLSGAPLALLGLLTGGMLLGRRSPAALLAAGCAGWGVYVVVVGGDWMPGLRLLLPVAGLGVVSVFLAARAAWPRRRSLAVVLLACLLAAVAARWSDPQNRRILGVLVHNGPIWRDLGVWLHEQAPADTVVALNAAGMVPYYSGLRTIDMLGINDRYIARHHRTDWALNLTGHQIGNGLYVLSQRPDVVIFGSTGWREPFGFVSEAELWQMPAFRRGYVPWEVRLAGGHVSTLYLRRGSGLLSRLSSGTAP